MTKDEAIRCLESARLMLLGPDGQPISDLYYALSEGIEALRKGLDEEQNESERNLIRCKDCKHRDMEKGFCEAHGWPMQLVPDNGFCDKAEKQTDKMHKLTNAYTIGETSLGGAMK